MIDMVKATKQQMVEFLYQLLPYTKKQLNSLSQEKLMEAINKYDKENLFKAFVLNYNLYKKYFK